MSDTQLLVATSNQGKVHEISSLLGAVNRKLLFLSDLDTHPLEPEETGASFAENAQLKARYYAQLSQFQTIADDSGLSVLELDGFPGVTSARWVSGSDSDRIEALLALLTERGLNDPVQRRAYFSCAISLAMPNQEYTVDFEGVCWGTLAHVPLGETGFGYDPIFIPDGESMTMGQLGPDKKNVISARSIALRKLASWLLQH